MTFHHLKKSRGFALVATLILMVLITVIALGLLSLSSTTLRASGAAVARSQAQANARMALTLAIGQLQLQTGLDTRITAPADFINPADPDSIKNRMWYGAWRSDQTEPTTYPTARQDAFLGWLVTTTGVNPNVNDANTDLSSSADSTLIAKIPSSGSSPVMDVRVPLLVNDSDKGRLGWWTVDESTKARADLPVVPIESSSPGPRLVARHAAPRPQPEGLPEVTGFKPTASQSAAMVTPGQLHFGATAWPDSHGKNFTTYAKSLLTDARNGGFKQDLSTLFELPETTITATGDFGAWMGQDSYKSPKSYLYGNPGEPMGARWNMLYQYYNLYKEITFNGAEPTIAVPASIPAYNSSPAQTSPTAFGDKSGGFRSPRIASLSYVISYDDILQPNPQNPLEIFKLRLHAMAYVTLWNPFDTRITYPAGITPNISVHSRVPLQLEVMINGALKGNSGTDLNTLLGGYHFFDALFHAPGPGSSQFSIGPGESISFAYDPTSKMFERDTGGQLSPTAFITTFDAGVYGKQGDTIKLTLKPYEYNFSPGSNDNFNSHILFSTQKIGGGISQSEYRGEPKALSGAKFIGVLEPAPTDTISFKTLYTRVATYGGPINVLGFKMSMKTASDIQTPGGYHTPAFLYSALESLHSVVFGDPSENLSSKYEFSSVAFASSGETPIDYIGTNGGYGLIASGDTPSSGQSHFIAASLPKVPPTSLAQFRHAGTGTGANLDRANLWGQGARSNWMYFGNQDEFHALSPFVSQAIGNSYAQPLIPADKATQHTDPSMASLPSGDSYTFDDHSYEANRFLWDKYFFSSLAPQSSDRFDSAKTMSQSWEDFLKGKDRLLNSRFSPLPGQATAGDLQSELFSGTTLKNDAYKKIATRLMLEGGFNINSTSVDAWRAILSSTFGQKLTKIPKTSSGSSIDVSGNGAIYSRSDIVLSGSVDEPGADPETHYTGYRDLDDQKISSLAEQIVNQVRLRGPFLNLSQFINRRLSMDTQLALSGPLQTAIDAAGLNDKVKSEGQATAGNPGGATMKFAEPAKLGSAAGNTGWLMQGDILDPIGPSLVVRGDTFRIRAYGDARSASGEVLARAWCEAVVQRLPEFVDPNEAPGDMTLASGLQTPTLAVNKVFGRRYQTIQFRWLSGPDA